MRHNPHIPWFSLVLAAAAVAIYPSPLLQQWLEFDRQAVAAGELWRIVSCHWTHWSAEHLFWDAGMFVLLAAACELRSRRALLFTLGASAVLIPIALWRVQPEMPVYRGLSGLDSALFFLVVVQAARQSLARRQWPRVAMLAVLVAAFAAKIGYETFQGAAVFVHTGGFIPVPLAHTVGALVGLTVGLCAARLSGDPPDVRRRQRRSPPAGSAPARPAQIPPAQAGNIQRLCPITVMHQVTSQLL